MEGVGWGCRDVLPSKWANLVPIPSAFGLPFYLGPNYAVTMGLGSVIKYIWERNDPTGAQLFVIPGALCHCSAPSDLPNQAFLAQLLCSHGSGLVNHAFLGC